MKIWEVDPLTCSNCGGDMKIISFITEPPVIRHEANSYQYSGVSLTLGNNWSS